MEEEIVVCRSTLSGFRDKLSQSAVKCSLIPQLPTTQTFDKTQPRQKKRIIYSLSNTAAARDVEFMN